jgi:hypothetical protein
MNYGLLDGLLGLREYVLGSSTVPFVPYNPSGDWTKYLPQYEPQAERYETNGCTVWGAQNQVEILYKYLFDIEPNYAERFNYLLTPVNPNKGANPQDVYENIRKYGLIDAKYLPVPRTKREFLNMSDITDGMYDEGEMWLELHDLKHEWLWATRPDNWKAILKETLKTSPIGVSVSAWVKQDGKYVSGTRPNNHWCVLYKVDEDGTMWVFDSYDHSQKPLHPEHHIKIAKRVWLNRRTKRSMGKHVKLLQDVVKALMFKPQTLLEYAQESLGIDVTPDDLIPDAVACAITLTTLINKSDKTFPKVAGTWTLWDILEHNPKYERVTVPSPGTIVISPTGTGNGSINGHAGLFMEDMTIASNDSNSGKFIKNYTLDTWHRRYVGHGGFKIFMYKQKV